MCAYVMLAIAKGLKGKKKNTTKRKYPNNKSTNKIMTKKKAVKEDLTRTIYGKNQKEQKTKNKTKTTKKRSHQLHMHIFARDVPRRASGPLLWISTGGLRSAGTARHPQINTHLAHVVKKAL